MMKGRVGVVNMRSFAELNKIHWKTGKETEINKTGVVALAEKGIHERLFLDLRNHALKVA